MSLTHASDSSAQEDREQRDAKVALPLSDPDTLQTTSVEPDSPESDDLFWTAQPVRLPPARRGRTRSSHRSAAARVHWKRQCLRRSQRRAKQSSHRIAVTFSLSATIPLLLLLVIITTLLGAAIFYYQSQQSALAHIANDFPNDSLKIYDAQGNLIDEISSQGLQTTLPLSQIPKVLQNATIAIEDKDFWTNQGVDFQAVVRATLDDVRSNQIVSGASTITQQLIKNALLGPEVTLDRKLREMILALGLNREMSKQDILSLYLNTIY
jgi:hypothetical protein